MLLKTQTRLINPDIGFKVFFGTSVSVSDIQKNNTSKRLGIIKESIRCYSDVF